MAKKGQGLPLNLIVLAAMAALILVLVIAFTIGGAGAFFGKIFRGGVTAVGEEINVVQTTCNSLCQQAQTVSSTVTWKTSQYCRRTFNVDRNGDGVLNQSTSDPKANEVGLHCADDPITVSCSASITTAAGSVQPVSQKDC